MARLFNLRNPRFLATNSFCGRNFKLAQQSSPMQRSIKNLAPALYECKLSLDKNEVLHVDDAGSPFPQAIYRSYCYAIGEEDTFREKYRESDDRGLDNDDAEWLRWLSELASPRGHKLLSYDNEVEGADLSYCILDTNSITDVVSTSLTWEEIAELHRTDSAGEHGYDKYHSQMIGKFLIR